jgi:putative ABC transport system permease protein
MLKKYFTMTWRQWRSSLSYTLINLGGLTVGLAVALLIGLWTRDEWRFDHYFDNHSRLAQVMDTRPLAAGFSTEDGVPPPLAAELQTKLGRFFRRVAVVFPNFPHVLAAGEKRITASGQWAQPAFPEMLTLKMIGGSRDALKDPSSVLIDRSTAIALFGSSSPGSPSLSGEAASPFDPSRAIGQTIRVDNTIAVKVAGIYEDLPVTTTFAGTHILLSWDKAAEEMPWMKGINTQWDADGFWLFVELDDPSDIKAASTSIKDILRRHRTASKEDLSLYPMDRWHLYSEFSDGHSVSGRIRIVRLFAVIGAFVLLLACINFMNLSTARSDRRAREVGIRKTLGSLRRQIISQFLAESVCMALLAFILAVGIVWLSLPLFDRLAAKDMVIPWDDAICWLAAIGFTLFTGILAGSYPAFYLSGFQPVKVLKGNAGPSSTLPRKALVVLQFTVSITLIIGTVIIYRQIQYARQRSIGYAPQGLLAFRMNTKDIIDAPYNAMRNDLLQTGAVTDMAQSVNAVTEMPGNADSIDWVGKATASKPPITVADITHDFGRTLGWTVIAGRDYSREFVTDSTAVIINESAARLIGWKDPVGRNIRLRGHARRIIGIVKDMVMGSPYQAVPATVFEMNYYIPNYLLIRVNPSLPMSAALNKIAPVLKKYNPEAPFECRFIDQDYALKFAAEQQVAGLSAVFAVLAILISCLGLFALAAYMAERRTKEIGIRKVLGAGVTGIVALLSGDFLQLIGIALVLAIPLSWWGMHQWLQSYAWRTRLNWLIFAGAAVSTMLIALLTVSVQAIRVALANPVDSLRAD